MNYDYEECLNIKLSDNDSGKNTVKEYLLELLLTLWKKEESFSGKRPFGNSGWIYDLIIPVSEHFNISDTEADKLISSTIEYLGKK